jgi:hypothetical protein
MIDRARPLGASSNRRRQHETDERADHERQKQRCHEVGLGHNFGGVWRKYKLIMSWGG